MKKPIKPFRLILIGEEYTYDSYVSIKDIIEKFSEAARVDFQNIEIFDSCDFGFHARYIKKEPIEEFNERMKQYEKKLSEYKIWYEENKDIIKIKKEKQTLINKKNKLKKELEDIDSRLNS